MRNERDLNFDEFVTAVQNEDIRRLRSNLVHISAIVRAESSLKRNNQGIDIRQYINDMITSGYIEPNGYINWKIVPKV